MAPAPSSSDLKAAAKRRQSTFVGGASTPTAAKLDEPKKMKSTSQRQREKKLQAYLDQTWVQLLLGADLLITLYMPDFWVIGDAHDNADDVMNVILLIG